MREEECAAPSAKKELHFLRPTLTYAATLPVDLVPVFKCRLEASGDDAPLFPLWLNLRRDLRVACKRAGIAPVSPNDLRRTFASWLTEQGVPELVTGSLMGHANSHMVRRVYGRIGSEAQRMAIAQLPALALAPEAPAVVTESAVPKGVPEKVAQGGRSGPGGQDGQMKNPARKRGFGVPRGGIEPSTRGFSIHCSTN